MVEVAIGSGSDYGDDSRDMEENSYCDKGSIARQHHFLLLECGVCAVLRNIIVLHSLSSFTSAECRKCQLLRIS